MEETIEQSKEISQRKENSNKNLIQYFMFNTKRHKTNSQMGQLMIHEKIHIYGLWDKTKIRRNKKQ